MPSYEGLKFRLVFAPDDRSSVQHVQFASNRCINDRGSDWQCWKNQWNAELLQGNDPAKKFFLLDDPEVVTAFVERMMCDDTGVNYIKVQPYLIELSMSSAVPVDFIVELLNQIGRDLDIERATVHQLHVLNEIQDIPSRASRSRASWQHGAQFNL